MKKNVQSRMKRFLFVVVVFAVAGTIGFVAGGLYLNKGLLDEHNEMASDNFATAVAMFRDGYQAKRIAIFGESEEYSSFVIGTYEFVVIPGSETTSDRTKRSFNPAVGNMAAHINGMAVMLACKWVGDGDARGEQLLEKLRKIIPNFQISAPGIEIVAIKDLQLGSEMMKSEANQWGWRMGGSQTTETDQQGATPQPTTRVGSSAE